MTLEKRFEIETKCLEHLREFIAACKAEGLNFGENGYLSVGIIDGHISIGNGRHDVSPEYQVDASADPRSEVMQVMHVTATGGGRGKVDFTGGCTA